VIDPRREGTNAEQIEEALGEETRLEDEAEERRHFMRRENDRAPERAVEKEHILDELLEKSAKRVISLKVIVGAAIAVILALVSGVLWARSRPSRQDLEESVAIEARTNMAMHKDLQSQNRQMALDIATILERQKAMCESQAETNAQLKELRGYLVVRRAGQL
jgi:hypothetical protein